MKIHPLAVAALAGALALAGCGKLGRLDRPGPLFGHAPPPGKAAGQAKRHERNPASPVDTVDPRDGSMEPPTRTQPIEGTSPDPFATAPQGTLPNPYANPSQ
jgi:hypothetical protein